GCETAAECDHIPAAKLCLAPGGPLSKTWNDATYSEQVSCRLAGDRLRPNECRLAAAIGSHRHTLAGGFQPIVSCHLARIFSQSVSKCNEEVKVAPVDHELYAERWMRRIVFETGKLRRTRRLPVRREMTAKYRSCPGKARTRHAY